VRTSEDQAAAVGHSVDVEQWLAVFDNGFARIAGRFGRVEPRRRARSFLLALLSDVDTRTCWQLAEQAGDGSPQGMQRLLGEAVWDADAVRDDVRGYVVDELGDPGAVLILDDTGDLKKGVHSVGVQRQYTGTAGRIENSQVAVFLAYASARGHALIDREIYLPHSWCDDPARCAAAGVPEQVRFATKITLARRMLTRAAQADVPAAWATADEFYGGRRGLRRDLQARSMGYVLAVAKNHRLTTTPAIGPQRVDQITASLSLRTWNRYSAGHGAKGPHDYDWAWVAITPPPDETTGHHYLLVRRNISTGELAFYRCWSPWSGWPAPAGASKPPSKPARTPPAWTNTRSAAGIPLSVNEIRRLFAKLVANTIHTISHCLAWSHWRRLHQARATTSRYRRRNHPEHQLEST
jgi:SRSO17 transposase